MAEYPVRGLPRRQHARLAQETRILLLERKRPSIERVRPSYWTRPQAVPPLSAIRDDYIRRFHSRARAEAVPFAQGSPEDRVRRAALARTAAGRKHKHQWRIPPMLLEKFATRLVGRLREIVRTHSFSDLLAVVDGAKLKGVSELTVYDTAVRIAAGQRIEPDAVYLHAGTRKGAARLGWNVRRASISLTEMPPELAGLSASEIEDLLCSYARYFGPNAERFSPQRCDGGLPVACGDTALGACS